jgi:nicotinamide-nucleotide amidase
MRVELINTGSELLLGQVVNTHLTTLAELLWPLGLSIERQVTVPDGDAIRDAMQDAFGRADIVLVTGGLGPTTDDLTRDIAAELLGLEMHIDPTIENAIRERLEKRGIRFTDRILRQAQRPSGAEILANRHGTAPGLYLPPVPLPGGKLSPHLFLLPGPPRELKPMVEDELLPRLRALIPESPRQQMQTWRVIGIPESHVEEGVGEALIQLGIEPGYCARPNEVDVRIIGTEAQLLAAEMLLKKAFGSAMLPKDTRSLEQWLVETLTQRGQTLATAESCTGGALACRITDVPGSSAIFGHGFVTYANTAKIELGVPSQLLETHGAVSAPVAEALARNAKRLSGADFALSTTGIAGPGGGSDEKPVGIVFIALVLPDGSVVVEKYRYQTDRQVFKQLTTQAAFNLLRRSILT